MSEGGCQQSQALLGAAQRQDKRPQAEPESQEVAPEHEEELLSRAVPGHWHSLSTRGAESLPLEAVLCPVPRAGAAGAGPWAQGPAVIPRAAPSRIPPAFPGRRNPGPPTDPTGARAGGGARGGGQWRAALPPVTSPRLHKGGGCRRCPGRAGPAAPPAMKEPRAPWPTPTPTGWARCRRRCAPCRSPTSPSQVGPRDGACGGGGAAWAAASRRP